jgi:hypothetical protein
MKPTLLVTLAALALAATAHAGGHHSSQQSAPAIDVPILDDPLAPAYQDEPGYWDAWYARWYAEHDHCKHGHQ